MQAAHAVLKAIEDGMRLALSHIGALQNREGAPETRARRPEDDFLPIGVIVRPHRYGMSEV